MRESKMRCYNSVLKYVKVFSPAVEVKGSGAVITAKEVSPVPTRIAERIVLNATMFLSRGGWGGE